MKDYGLRDQVVSWLANQVLRLASQRYQGMIKGAIALGLEAAAAANGGNGSRAETGLGWPPPETYPAWRRTELAKRVEE